MRMCSSHLLLMTSRQAALLSTDAVAVDRRDCLLLLSCLCTWCSTVRSRNVPFSRKWKTFLCAASLLMFAGPSIMLRQQSHYFATSAHTVQPSLRRRCLPAAEQMPQTLRESRRCLQGNETACWTQRSPQRCLLVTRGAGSMTVDAPTHSSRDESRCGFQHLCRLCYTSSFVANTCFCAPWRQGCGSLS